MCRIIEGTGRTHSDALGKGKFIASQERTYCKKKYCQYTPSAGTT
jgi:hypothetical protein